MFLKRASVKCVLALVLIVECILMFRFAHINNKHNTVVKRIIHNGKKSFSKLSGDRSHGFSRLQRVVLQFSHSRLITIQTWVRYYPIVMRNASVINTFVTKVHSMSNCGFGLKTIKVTLFRAEMQPWAIHLLTCDHLFASIDETTTPTNYWYGPMWKSCWN